MYIENCMSDFQLYREVFCFPKMAICKQNFNKIRQEKKVIVIRKRVIKLYKETETLLHTVIVEKISTYVCTF